MSKSSFTAAKRLLRLTRSSLLLVVLFLSVGYSRGLLAQTDPGSAFFFNGTLDLATAFSEDGAPELHELIRGDSHFDNLRLRLFGDVALNDRLVVFSQFLIDPAINFGFETFLRTYLRFTVFQHQNGDLSIQVGKLPTPFGSIGQRAYSEHNPLISSPLMYHYFTSLRSNQLPAGNADLLSQRGNGLGREFDGFLGGGSAARFSGLPMIYDPCWDTGLEVIGSLGRLEFLVAVTQGTLSAPRFSTGDNNGGKQIAVHGDFVASPSLVVGASFARGPYLDQAVSEGLRPTEEVEDFLQEIFGVNLEYSYRHFVLNAEFASNHWESPNIVDSNGIRTDLENKSWYLEGKYAVRPGIYLALRYDEIRFDSIDDGTGSGREEPWDYNVRSLESGLGYYFTNKVIGKIIRKDYKTAEPGTENSSFWAVQLSASF